MGSEDHRITKSNETKDGMLAVSMRTGSVEGFKGLGAKELRIFRRKRRVVLSTTSHSVLDPKELLPFLGRVSIR